ncbi:MAG: GNAT family N-acetyltransferase [Caulobacter sp.]|nr:GNAT family N-acetyltransferase [Vitreoscilla sp.]
MTLAIRPTPPDHPQVLALITELDAYLESLYEPEDVYILDLDGLKHPAVTFLGAWSGDELVGCGAVRLMPAEPTTDDRPYGEIKRMFVSPTRRGERIGQRLLESLEGELRQRGIDPALLETGPPQREALALYMRCGYAPRGVYGGYPDKPSASVFMEKRWNPA